MGRRNRTRAREARASIENPTVPVSAANFLEFFGVTGGGRSAAGIHVTIEDAMGVPAIWDAVNFMAGTLASLPFHLYRKRRDGGTDRVSGALATILHDAANDETSSFDWRLAVFTSVFTYGRSCTFIERNASGRIINLWPLDQTAATVKRENGRRRYHYRDGTRPVVYEAAEIIDIPFCLKSDGITHRSPILANRDVVGMAIAATQYASKFFQNGGVPPFAIKGQFTSPGAMQRASDDLAETVRKTAREERLALVLPAGLEITPIGADAEKTQLVETQRFLIEQVARIYSLPPTFLQDLSHGTFSNTEQQDLHFVKHTLSRWVQQFEQEINLKLFGRAANSQFAALNVDGLMRGDFKTRMEGYASGIQNGVLMPNEARTLENRPPSDGGDRLYVQGATVPLAAAGAPQPNSPDPTSSEGATNAA